MKSSIRSAAVAIVVATTYAVVLRLLFGVKTWNNLFEVMSFTFLFCLPVIIGAITVYFSSEKLVRRYWYQFWAPWIPVFLFLAITLALSIEGWGCWVMLLPVFLIAASIGGCIGAHLKLRRMKNDKLNASVLFLLPLLIAPIEHYIGKIPGQYEAVTYIDIEAKPETIWANVTRVKAIPEDLDSGYLNNVLGFPRPVKAELDREAVGGYRKAIFTNGLVFHENVLAYKPQQYMRFSIKAFPYEIPSTTLDEHVVIGGKYFDVLEGEYRLEKLSDDKYRLHLKSNFKLRTSFNFYASFWAKWIMEDIQNNILRVQKIRSEQNNS
jgi:hypothetical protein